MTSQSRGEERGGLSSPRSKITPERERELYEATLDLLREGGYEALTMEGIAARTRCGKSTLYRQWGGKPRLVAAALRAQRRVRFSGIDTGSLAGDLREAARAGAERGDRDGLLVQALAHAVLQDEDLQQALREALVHPETSMVDAMLDRAEGRGEIPVGHPAREFVAAQIFGVLRVRPVLEGRRPHPAEDAAYLQRFVDICILPALGLTSPAGPPPRTGGPAGDDRRGRRPRG
ncbi:TetR/AcrR family transcriptional regulator [Streptomyces sp. SID8014]|uniref:TetR/AcrR family transcriptional regulator n=1 Tax=Streptomyces sp. SID8014 TaxID=2706097 RepID=UPI0013B8C1F9|nr:TetR/AcrR family transcriptional regulator [Streptomyces sp. SID8014]NEC16429.1 TetR/AcrR family transcriptional regulator [Streptomyces sp. SID8014]